MKCDAKILTEFCKNILMKAGLDDVEAALNAESLIMAELRGIPSHGVARLGTYAGRIRAGVVKAGQKVEIASDSPSALLIDANNGTGPFAGMQAMEICMERARGYGCCFAAVRNANHFGIGAFFTMRAAENGMIGIAMSNCPASVVPTNGAKPMFGTNPLSVAVPGGAFPPLVLDMATSVVAQGKVILADKEGRPIPDTWAVDEDGKPTTDPGKALKGAMLPFGGAKGYSISFIIEVLCSVLSGANNSREINNFWNDFKNPQNLGYFMGAIDIGKFMPPDIFLKRMDKLVGDVKNCPPAPGCREVFVPGELEHRSTVKYIEEGVEIGNAVAADMKKLGELYGAQWPFR